jgi:mRNA-degrading endonuclease RelE of RelBE toxin-antitoxin system
MRFVETPIFTPAVEDLLEEESYRSLQLTLLLRPATGAMIPGSGGLRKIRWSLKGKGKRGGCRIIGYWDEPSETFCMLYAYGKNEQEDLTVDQLRVLSRLVHEEFG